MDVGSDVGISAVIALFISGAQANTNRGMIKTARIFVEICLGMDDVIYSAAGLSCEVPVFFWGAGSKGSASAGGGFISNETWRGSALGPSG